MESIVLGIYLWFKIYFLIDTNTKMWTEITDLVIFRKKLLKFRQGVAVSKEFIAVCELCFPCGSSDYDDTPQAYYMLCSYSFLFGTKALNWKFLMGHFFTASYAVITINLLD